ncbi:vacuolar basic amino acid transporter 1 [[Candida] railenensis]|uniref:Vacuolar basic amino acid transporter 1 n=1 Tax=[Candida] railenensis TaxID=45579 RepID=A0A9P0QS36_9ASCO|nr:vacuolar basic amino acid transporter 1 [[Candida] railenensis]
MTGHLHPNTLNDASTGTPGVVAGELAAEEQSLIGHESSSYGATNPDDVSGADADDDKDFAMPKSQVYIVVSSLFMAAYLAALDTTVVTTLLTEIASDLNAISSISWIATAYLLSCSAFQPLFGKLSDIFGRKALLLLCSFSFAIGCFICSTDSLIMIIVGRFITGIGGGGLTSLGTITMSDIVPLRSRGLYQGLANVCFGLGAASGGVLGGFVADKFGWKNVFLLQVPLAVIVGVAIYLNLNLPEGSPGLGAQGVDIKSKLKRVDFLGSSLLVSSLMGIMAAASFGGNEIAYSSATFVILCAVSFALLGGFVYVELYVSPEPVLPLELMADRTVLSSSLTNWFYTMGVFTYLFYIPIYYTSVMGFTATQNGLRLIPNFFGVSFGSVGAGIYMKTTGRYYKLAVLSGFVSLYGVFRIYTITPSISLLDQFTMTIPPGLGYSSILTITLLSLIAAVPAKYQASTTSIQYTFRATGSTLGVSIASAIFQSILKSTLTSRIYQIVSDPNEAKEIISKALENAQYSHVAPKLVQQAIRDSYNDGCKGAFAFTAATVTIGFLCSLFMREHVLHTSINRD